MITGHNDGQKRIDVTTVDMIFVGQDPDVQNVALRSPVPLIG